MLVDSHCHLNYLEDPDLRLDEARARGVSGVLCIGVDEGGIEDVLALAQAHTDVWASVGQHPEGAAADPSWIVRHLDAPRVVALGETGLDYHHESDAGARARQRKRFEYQLGLAQDTGLPVVVHTRAAEADTLELLRAHESVRGVLHCFTESWQMARAALDLGFHISISGIVTFKSADNVREVAAAVPADRLLVETDAPWLAPVPHRGQTNAPAFVRDTAHFLATLRQVDEAELAERTTENFFRLFDRAQKVSSNS